MAASEGGRRAVIAQPGDCTAAQHEKLIAQLMLQREHCTGQHNWYMSKQTSSQHGPKAVSMAIRRHAQSTVHTRKLAAAQYYSHSQQQNALDAGTTTERGSSQLTAARSSPLP